MLNSILYGKVMKQRTALLMAIALSTLLAAPHDARAQQANVQQVIADMDQMVAKAAEYGQQMQRYYYSQPGDADYKDFAISTIQSACIRRAPDKTTLGVGDYVRGALRFAWSCYNAVDGIGGAPMDMVNDNNANAALPPSAQNNVTQNALSRRREVEQYYERYKQLYNGAQ